MYRPKSLWLRQQQLSIPAASHFQSHISYTTEGRAKRHCAKLAKINIDKEDIDKEDIDKEDIDKEDIDKEDIDKEDIDKEDIDKDRKLT